MKPSKKQVVSKKPVNEKASSSGIKTFFKSTPKSFVIEQNVAEAKACSSKDSHKQFYVEILKDKLARIHGEDVVGESGDISRPEDHAFEEQIVNVTLSNDDQATSGNENEKESIECAGCIETAIERDMWKEKYEKEVEKYDKEVEKYNEEVEDRKQLKKVYLNLTHRFSELHSKYTDLLRVATKPSVDESADNAASETPVTDVFTAAEVKFLQCMDLEKKMDCTFVLHCLKYAYKNNLSEMPLKTLKGTSEWTQIANDGQKIVHPAKAPLTPGKVQRTRELFIERISKCSIDAAEYSERMKEAYINKLFAAGIKNLSKKKRNHTL